MDDKIYYRDAANSEWSLRILSQIRKNMLDLFMKEFSPTSATKIIDIGVSDEENSAANFLEKHYNWKSNIVGAGLGSGEAFKKVYPDIVFKKIIPNCPLPFNDQSFDIACSNAVLEHVGGKIQRANFIAEHLRVARHVFISFPNRWFPIEHHTGIPLIHYYPELFRKLLKGTKLNYWCSPLNLEFLDKDHIAREWPSSLAKPSSIKFTGISLGPLSSNIAIILKR